MEKQSSFRLNPVEQPIEQLEAPNQSHNKTPLLPLHLLAATSKDRESGLIVSGQ
jgi:hypothetical protein